MRTDCGYTTAEIDAMTLPEYIELCEFWNREPTIRAMMMAYFKIKPKRRPEQADFGQLVALLGSSVQK